MTAEYISRSEAIKTYNLNENKFSYAIRQYKFNGLYKALFRKKTRLFFRVDYFEKWLETIDMVGPSMSRKKKTIEDSDQTIRLQSRRRHRYAHW